MTEAEQILAAAGRVLVVDYPSRTVPETLARAGFEVVVRGGPGPTDYAAYEIEHGEVVVRRTGRPPDGADVVYAHRPLPELAAIVETAQALGAHAVWLQSGVNERGAKDEAGCWMSEEDATAARAEVERAGLALVWDASIVEAARQVRRQPQAPPGVDR